MYLCTDINAISAALEGAAPRNVEEVMLEHYPDATIDAMGRAHAPHDGYEFDGTIYRGGEYLPEPPEFDELAELKKMMARGRTPKIKVFHAGKVVVFEGTKGQIKAAREVAKAQMAEFDKTRGFVGAEKKRDVFELTLFAMFSNVGVYGPEHTHYMRDADLNPVIYRGSKVLCNEGETVRVKATVKTHWASPDGERRATYINRPQIQE